MTERMMENRVKKGNRGAVPFAEPGSRAGGSWPLLWSHPVYSGKNQSWNPDRNSFCHFRGVQPPCAGASAPEYQLWGKTHHPAQEGRLYQNPL